MTTKPTDDWEKELEEMFVYTDLSGDVGAHILVFREESYDTKEIQLNRLKDFIRQIRTQAYTEGVMKAYKSVKGELEYIASRNDMHNAVCIPAAERALSAIKALLP